MHKNFNFELLMVAVFTVIGMASSLFMAGIVNGHYTSLYAYDNTGNWYWDLGDGRVMGTKSSVAELDQATLTKCDYVVNYRGTYENNPYMDTGWI